MITIVLIVAILFLLVILGWCGEWLRYYRRTDVWVAERDQIFNAVYAAGLAMSQAARPHTDEQWGYSMGMPSKNSLKLLDAARQIEEERWEVAQVMKSSLLSLDTWQSCNPPPQPPRFFGSQLAAPIEYAKFDLPEVPSNPSRWSTTGSTQ